MKKAGEKMGGERFGPTVLETVLKLADNATSRNKPKTTIANPAPKGMGILKEGMPPWA